MAAAAPVGAGTGARPGGMAGGPLGQAARARARRTRGEDSTHGVGASLGPENRRDGEAAARRRRACHSHATGERRHAIAALEEKEEGYTTNKNLRRIAAAPLQPRVRLEGPEVPAENLRRERDARLQGYDGHDRDSRRVHVLALQQVLQ